MDVEHDAEGDGQGRSEAGLEGSGRGAMDALKAELYPNGWTIQSLGTHLSAHAEDVKDPDA